MSDENQVVEPAEAESKIDINMIKEMQARIKELEEQARRLKEHNDKVVEDRKAANAKREAAELRAQQAKAEAEGDMKQLLELKEKEYQKELQALKEKNESYENERKDRMLNDEAMRLASELAKTNPGRAKLLAKELKERLKLTEDGIKVVDERGNLISDKTDSLMDYAKSNYDFLCDGLQSTGGGATGSSSTVVQKRFSEMDESEKVALWRDSPSKYNAAKAADINKGE